MSQFIEQANGYIIDNPTVDYKRCDDTIFHYDEVATTSVTNNGNTITINGGQGNYPLAIIDTDRTTEITLASAQFKLEMFQMATDADAVDGDYGTLESELYEVDNALKVTIPYETKEGSVSVRGFEVADAASTGKIKVEHIEATPGGEGQEAAGPKTVVTFAEGDHAEGDVLYVSYVRRLNGSVKVGVKSISKTSKGELYMHYPVYSSGVDCTESSVKGQLHIHYYRVRATALPGFDSSYKSAQTPQISFSLIDGKRADKVMYDLTYEPYSTDGEIVLEHTADQADW